MRRLLTVVATALCLLLADSSNQARASWLSQALHAAFGPYYYPYGPGYGYPPWGGAFPPAYGGFGSTYVQTYNYPPPYGYVPPVPYGPVPYYSPYYNAWRRHQWHEWREHAGYWDGYGWPVWHRHHD